VPRFAQTGGSPGSGVLSASRRGQEPRQSRPNLDATGIRAEKEGKTEASSAGLQPGAGDLAPFLRQEVALLFGALLAWRRAVHFEQSGTWQWSTRPEFDCVTDVGAYV